MGIEIERKFLVQKNLLEHVHLGEGSRFTQGYLSVRPVVRVRLSERADISEAWVTIKGEGTLKRSEFEYAVSPEDARGMLELCAFAISKTRYHVHVEGHQWDVDEFHGDLAGLWLAEVELTHTDETFVRPLWLGEEVTDDGQYTNAALAQRLATLSRR
jgi:adenylate cyclase